jgi:hypothetical protein
MLNLHVVEEDVVVFGNIPVPATHHVDVLADSHGRMARAPQRGSALYSALAPGERVHLQLVHRIGALKMQVRLGVIVLPPKHEDLAVHARGRMVPPFLRRQSVNRRL